MTYLNLEKLDTDDTFIEGLLTDDGYAQLVEEKPDVSMLTPDFGRKRNGHPHDRYLLEYKSHSPAWDAFVKELHGPDYTQFIQRRFGAFYLNMHWHYTPRGCSVSPHCDAPHKLGSHIFYLNTLDDWQEEWGGQTLVLGGKFDHDSAPDFDDFEGGWTSKCIGNVSTLLGRGWHGVRELTCPEGALRKVFIVVINRRS